MSKPKLDPQAQYQQQFARRIRKAYDDGRHPEQIRRRYNLSRSEMEDHMPEEFVERQTPEGEGGY